MSASVSDVCGKGMDGEGGGGGRGGSFMRNECVREMQIKDGRG